MNSSDADFVRTLIHRLGLQPLPVEGGLYRQTWRGPENAGTCIYMLLTDEPDSFSALHRLPTDEIWHFYLGDPLELLLLHPAGRVEKIVLGADVLGGQHCQFVVPAGAWMGARVRRGGRFTLFGCTMAPGFDARTFEAGDRQALLAAYPACADDVLALTRPDAAAAQMPDDA